MAWGKMCLILERIVPQREAPGVERELIYAKDHLCAGNMRGRRANIGRGHARHFAASRRVGRRGKLKAGIGLLVRPDPVFGLPGLCQRFTLGHLVRGHLFFR